MEKFIIVLIGLLLSLPRFARDTETPEERTARMQKTAHSVDRAVDRATCTGDWKSQADCRRVWNGSKRELTAAVIAIGFHESTYAQAVYEGKCETLPKGMRCDNGRARTYWQLWKSACPEAWQTEPGSDEQVDAGAWCAAKQLSYFYGYCQTLTGEDHWSAAFTAYAGRGCKTWPGSAARRATMNRLLAKL